MISSYEDIVIFIAQLERELTQAVIAKIKSQQLGELFKDLDTVSNQPQLDIVKQKLLT